MSIEIIKQTFRLAKAAREKHEDEISEAYKFTRPNRDIWRNRESDTDRTKIFDSTAPDSVHKIKLTRMFGFQDVYFDSELDKELELTSEYVCLGKIL